MLITSGEESAQTPEMRAWWREVKDIEQQALAWKKS